ncbi:hypothetical protein [Blastococcus xanthinilyticus]|uniref:YjbR protein n=1 Tax=Blastococcus xanthinilyticus TaxID=1564164 RepID=A0A5S5CXV0_9ACTN|nr:hypothetical protein [Blastococcus xanthinilyticus]TYP88610.1 hypothetical protein BD833_104318 [Blastococcus xanthinilyticus]
MAGWEDVRRLVAGLPGTDEHLSYGGRGRPSWRVRVNNVVWALPLREGERAALGDGTGQNHCWACAWPTRE